MSDFLKFAFEVISQVVYNIAQLIAAVVRLFITGWGQYFTIFFTYFGTLSLPAKLLAIILMLILIAVPILAIVLLVRAVRLRRKLKGDKEDNAELYREIGKLNRQVLNLIDEKNKILALKVSSIGGTERVPYAGASALLDDTIPTLGNVTGHAAPAAAGVGGEIANAQITIQNGHLRGEAKEGEVVAPESSRFPKLTLVDEKYADYVRPAFADQITGSSLAARCTCITPRRLSAVLWRAWLPPSC